MLEAGSAVQQERRGIGTGNVTIHNLPATVKTDIVGGDPFEEVAEDKFFELLQRQLQISSSGKYRIGLITVKISVNSMFAPIENSIIRTAAQLLQLNIRPTDILIRCPSDTLSIVLHDANDLSIRSVIKRLASHIEKAMKNSVQASFGRSDLSANLLSGANIFNG